MSLPFLDTQASLLGSVHVLAGDLFSRSDRYRLFAEKIFPLLLKARAELQKCYCADNGRPGVEPTLLLGVLLFQFLERVPDRQAVDLVKYHLGWKLALNLELARGAFHATSLVHFRQRLLEHEQGALLFRVILDALVDNGLLPRHSRQRLDSTHVVGLVARISALECVRETLRLALEELAPKLAQEERPEFWPLYWERYVESKLDYKSSEQSLKAKQQQAGENIQWLLRWLEALPVEVRQGRQVALLRQVFAEQYNIEESGELAPVKIRATGVVQIPHEAEAKWSAKGQGKAKKDWVGYKVQVAESVSAQPRQEGAPTPDFITSIVTQEAVESDDAGLPATLESQEALGLEKPPELYVDGAYVSAAALAEAQSQGRELMGPAQPSPTKRPAGFRTEDFEVDVEERRALCPAGKENTQCSRLEEVKSGKISYRFEWSTHCHDCALREQCAGADQKHRTLVVGEHHTHLQQRRREQKTEVFRERMKVRNAIEGTQRELVRGHGLRRARYRGKARVNLQNQLIGAACNVKRWLRRLAWEIKAKAAQTLLTSEAIWQPIT
jgi:hypothetical protein